MGVLGWVLSYKVRCLFRTGSESLRRGYLSTKERSISALNVRPVRRGVALAGMRGLAGHPLRSFARRPTGMTIHRSRQLIASSLCKAAFQGG